MYRSQLDAIKDLEKHGHLLRIKSEIDPYLEAAEIHRRIFDKKGPALLFENLKGTKFMGCSNIYGTYERTDFLFRKTLDKVKKVTELKADFTQILKIPLRYLGAPFTALTALPGKALFSKPILYDTCAISDLPQVVSWPDDGGAFVTAPQVFTLPPGSKNIMESNLGMYRVQLSGNDYIQDKEIGMHYQLHRGIGVHHTAYNQTDEPFNTTVFIGGPPSFAFSAIMPMPEGLSELTFAGMLNGHRYKYLWRDGHVLSADADFCITGRIVKDKKKPEGPFGDHLGYYSLTHDFPVMEVDKVYHRKDAIWQFTVVGRPPQEDSSFGYLIHKLVEALTPGEFPGLKEINAVDAAGVHPLLLAIGQERYMPFRDKKPEEIITIANRILGSGQTSLAKFLIIAAEDEGIPSAHDITDFFQYVLQRIDWKRDLHFQTKTTIDTLDYSGDGWNAGSKVIMACNSDPIRSLSANLPTDFNLPNDFAKTKFINKGILAIQGPAFGDYAKAVLDMNELGDHLSNFELDDIPLIVVCDDSDFIAASENNFLWNTFTRANPSHDIYGVNSSMEFKHWGCTGPLMIDARSKPHHAPDLIADPEISKRVDKLFSKGSELYGY